MCLDTSIVVSLVAEPPLGSLARTRTTYLPGASNVTVFVLSAPGRTISGAADARRYVQRYAMGSLSMSLPRAVRLTVLRTSTHEGEALTETVGGRFAPMPSVTALVEMDCFPSAPVTIIVIVMTPFEKPYLWSALLPVAVVPSPKSHVTSPEASVSTWKTVLASPLSGETEKGPSSPPVMLLRVSLSVQPARDASTRRAARERARMASLTPASLGGGT